MISFPHYGTEKDIDELFCKATDRYPGVTGAKVIPDLGNGELEMKNRSLICVFNVFPPSYNKNLFDVHCCLYLSCPLDLDFIISTFRN